MRHCGLTLIELTIAMALSATVLLGAVAALRTAQQTMSVCTRLARENDAFRVGLMAGLDEIDFWTALDAPGGSAPQLVRRHHYRDGSNPHWGRTIDSVEWAGQENRGSQGPFKDWDFAAPYAGVPQPPPDPSYGSIPAFTGDAGVDGFANWTVDDPRTWFRGPFVLMGNDGSWSLGAYEQLQRVGMEEPSLPGSDRRRWLPNAVHAVARHGGVYAAVELLPPGTVYGWYRHDGKEQGIVLPFGPHSEGDVRKKNRGRYDHHEPWPELSRLQSANGVMLTAGIAAGPSAPEFARGEHRAQKSGLDFDHIRRRLRTETIVAPVRPTSYPEVTVTTRRMWVFMRPYNFCEVAVADPDSGSRLSLGFHCLGTSLRGARAQRAWTHGQWQGEDLDASW